jgi:pimeloyl-ACP methyl ester carboxylesterase
LLAAVIALSIMLAGCTRDAWWPSTSVTATTAASAPTPPPPPAELCGGPTTPAQSLWLSAPGGAQVYAAVVGTGPTTAVFVHQAGPTGLCGFWPDADRLARTNGVRSLLFSQCGTGASQCPPGNPADQGLATTTAAVAWARAHDAGRITLVGASAGGVVALSGERRWQGLDSLAAARRLQVPADGAGHGWELLGGAAGTDWSPLAVPVAAWIQGRHR